MADHKWFIYSFMIASLIFGTLNTIVGKAMDLTKSNGHTFNHPYFQTAGMFLGEILCLFYYFVYRKLNKQSLPVQEPLTSVPPKTDCLSKMGKFVFIIPSFFDFTASTLSFLGLVLSAPSVYQMLRGFIMVVVALYSIIFLKIKLFRHQILGVFFAFIGVCLVGLASVLYEASSAQSPILGAIIIIIAQFFTGGHFVVEQLFLENIVVHPLEAVGIEGLSGLGYYLIVLPIFNLIPCDNPDLCNGGYVENSVEAFKQIGDSTNLALLCVGFMLCISLFNFTGVTITQKSGALARSIIETARTVFIWLFSILVGWEVFIWLQLVGFLFLVLGTLVYNEILVIPWWGFTESISQKRIYMMHRAESKHEGKGDDNDVYSEEFTTPSINEAV